MQKCKKKVLIISIHIINSCALNFLSIRLKIKSILPYTTKKALKNPKVKIFSLFCRENYINFTIYILFFFKLT